MTAASRGSLASRARKIRLVLTDVDGVLTDGVLHHFVDTSGSLVEFKGTHAQDSIALAWLAESGIVTGVISGRMSEGTRERMKMLGVKHIYQKRLDKTAVFEEILRAEKLSPEQAFFMGDDLPDLPVLRRAGLSAAPADARPEARAAARLVTRARGGRGAFREAAELLLKSQGLWAGILARYR